MTEQWYYQSQGQLIGPLAATEFKSLAAAAKIAPETLVSTSARGPWVAAQQVPGLFGVSVKGPPPRSAAGPRPPAAPLPGDSPSTTKPRRPPVPPLVSVEAGETPEPTGHLKLVAWLAAGGGVVTALITAGALIVGGKDSVSSLPPESDYEEVGLSDAGERQPEVVKMRIDLPAPVPGRTMNPATLFAEASPAVVKIMVSDRRHDQVGQGSGFLIGRNGVLITNHHVIEGGRFFEVQLTDGPTVETTTVLAVDEEADLALLKAPLEQCPTVRMSGPALPAIGKKVFAIGSPLGLTNTLSDGLVSGHRTIGAGRTYIQTTAAISPGSSGGPLLTEQGLVVGVNTMTLVDGQNLNMAVPIERVLRLVDLVQVPSP